MIAREALPLTSESFPHIDADPSSLPSSIDPFTITAATGFLPIHKPLVHLPNAFKPLLLLLEAMPIVHADGTPGLLATFELGHMIDEAAALPDLTSHIDQLVAEDGKPDLAAVTAAFRDYSFLASAYLLEPCWERWSKDHDGGYGFGRDVLPACIAGPMVKCADILSIPPFLSYAASYALFNYTIKGSTSYSSIPPNYPSLSLIRAFEKGLDAKSSEAGFILTHIDMVSHTPDLIAGTASLLDHLTSCHNQKYQSPNPAILTSSLRKILTSISHIESSMSRMWANSRPEDYITFRTFIFGITSQSMFPSGVTYQISPSLATTLTSPVETWTNPLNFRGESGANDSIIPLLDSLLSIPMPSNPLTTILHEFRSYRPLPHREFLSYVRDRSELLNVRDVLATSSPETKALLLKLLDHIRSFRWRHWTFAREYIIKRTSHPTATGGSPIVRWLPNQLEAVLKLMIEIWKDGGDLAKDMMGEGELEEMMQNVYTQKEKLRVEVRKWCQEREEGGSS